MSLCRVLFYLTEELQTEALELSRFSRCFCLKHCRDSLGTVERYYLFWSLSRTMATVEAGTAGSNTGSAWRNEQRSVATDKSLSEFPLQRCTLLMANTLRVNQLSFDTVAPRESLCNTLPELEAFEVNDLLMITQSLTAVGNNCEDLKNTAVNTEWLPVTLVPGSMSDGLFGLRYTIPTPESSCNCFSLAALHSRRCGNWRAMKMAETLFPHYSYTPHRKLWKSSLEHCSELM